MNKIRIGDKTISEESPVFFTGEIGINHNGSLEVAKKMIDLAVICSADSVKFQKRTPEICVPEDVRDRIKETPWGDMTYFEYKKRIEFGEEEYREIDKYCKDKGIIWYASSWDILSAEFLEKLDVPCYKIPSAKLTDREMLETIRDFGKPVFLATGMSTEEEIDKAVDVLSGTDLVILHCNSSYPAVNEELNLQYIKVLKEKYPDAVIGYSGHELGISASLVAAVLGAKVIEKHITLDRAMWGTDQGASIDFSGLRRIIRDLKTIPVWLGDGVKKVYDSEVKVKEKLRDKDTL